MRIVYSFNKRGYEADFWSREISAASCAEIEFVPFNHDRYLNPNLYLRAQLLDDLWFARDPRLLRLYKDFEKVLSGGPTDAVIVDNCFPYHPEYLRSIHVYKVLRTTDGPLSAYDRDFAYLHAYDHVLYHSPAYSRDLTMEEKLNYCGATTFDWWPLGLFNAAYDSRLTEEELFSLKRDVDVTFVGAMHLNKMESLAKIKKALGRRFKMYGLTTLRRNLYFNAKYGFPGWVTPLAWDQYLALYHRTKIGINLHNRGDYTVGNYRMFELPANGVFQLSDGGVYLRHFFEPGSELVGYANIEELLGKIDHYLTYERERIEIARAGFRRVIRDYRIANLLRQGAALIARGIARRVPLRLPDVPV